MSASQRVLALARVSSETQASDGTSLAAQQDAFRAYCATSQLPAPTIYVEVESGGDTRQEHRAEVERLIADAGALAAAGNAVTVIVTKVDRWSRNLPWCVASVRALVKRGVRWISTGEGIDAATANGDFVLGIMAAVADQERQRIRERTVGARQRLRAQGFHVEGQPPLGFAVVDRKLVVDDAAAPVVRLMFALSIAGRSTREIAADLRAQFHGVPGLDGGAVARRIRDRRYLGESCSVGARGRKAPTGQWRVTHAAIVDADTWHRAQTSLTSRRLGGRRHGTESRTASFLLRGLLHCAHCGARMSAHSPEDGAGYYVCVRRTDRARMSAAERCAGPLVRRDVADAQLAAVALERLEVLAVELAKPGPKRPPLPDCVAARARLLKRRQRVVDAIADGAITTDAARSTMGEIEAALAAVEARPAAPPVDRAALLGQATTLRRLWDAMTAAERRDAIGWMVDRISVRSTATRKWQRGAWTIAVEWHRFE